VCHSKPSQAQRIGTTKDAGLTHGPQHGHHPSIQLLDERDLLGISLLVRAGVIRLADLRNRLGHLRVDRVVGLLSLQVGDGLALLVVGDEGGWWECGGHGEMRSTEFGVGGGVVLSVVMLMLTVVVMVIAMVGGMAVAVSVKTF
jgi:hypothetical protein